ncbi:MAG: hypothetical protein JSU94_00130 [Phycisphaerales bacterium]|nr:MAG: hypothetical protein JSU94_00130 [Phycisphaerales bacterium]
MFRRRAMRAVHLLSTAWFAACVGYILVLALRQAGVHWWILFSLSGHGVLIVSLLISLYLFAIFRGVSGSQKVESEHPLTSAGYYTVFYVTAPALGGLAGCLGMMGVVGSVSQFLLGVALGTLSATFFVWVIVDPVTGLLETMLHPGSRRNRADRLARLKAEREEQQEGRERFLADVLEREEGNLHRWRQALKPEAEKLAGLLTSEGVEFERAEREAVDVGVSAWQIGGLGCMRELRKMTTVICRKRSPGGTFVDYIPFWWDGIGTWQSPGLREVAGA